MRVIIDFVKCLFGHGNVFDGSVCRASNCFIDFHDYHFHKGGDGTPSHFLEYKCHKCGQKFSI